MKVNKIIKRAEGANKYTYNILNQKMKQFMRIFNKLKIAFLFLDFDLILLFYYFVSKK